MRTPSAEAAAPSFVRGGCFGLSFLFVPVLLDLWFQGVLTTEQEEQEERRKKNGLLPFEDRLSFFQEGGYAFDFVFGGEAEGEEVDFAAESFVEVGL